MHKLDSINYLSSGNTIQKEAYKILTDNNIMQYLYDFNPILVGTIPLEINIDGSDLDIICYWQDKQLFIDVINQCFSEYKDYTLHEVEINGYPTVIANFFIENFEIEIFGQNIPVAQQYGYRHMIIEYNILLQKGDEFKSRVIELKKQGYKTEPAFALLLDIKGNDPYTGLLNYEVHKN